MKTITSLKLAATFLALACSGWMAEASTIQCVLAKKNAEDHFQTVEGSLTQVDMTEGKSTEIKSEGADFKAVVTASKDSKYTMILITKENKLLSAIYTSAMSESALMDFAQNIGASCSKMVD